MVRPDSSNTNVKKNSETERLPRFLYAVVPMISVLVTVALVEVSFALFKPIPFSVERNMYYDPDPHTGYRIRPNSIGYFAGNIPGISNSHGHRDDEVSLEKAADTHRILVVGDSFTVGSNVRMEQAYPQVLEHLLNESLGRRVEVINASAGGWDPFQYAQYYDNYGKAFDPDLILVGFFVGNDTFSSRTKTEELRTAVLGRRIRREAAESRFIKLKVLLYNHSNIARLLLNRGPAPGALTREHCEDFTDHYLSIQSGRVSNYLARSESGEEESRNSVYQISRIRDATLLEARGLVVVLIPDEMQVNPGLRRAIINEDDEDRYDFRMPQSMLIEKFDGLGIRVIDLLPAFLDDERCLYMNDTHWSPEGHRLAAETILTELADVLSHLEADPET